MQDREYESETSTDSSDTAITYVINGSTGSEDDTSEETEEYSPRSSFEENEEVISMINHLSELCSPPDDDNIRNVEKAYERMKFLLNQYKEQPHLLDPYLDRMLGDIISQVLNDELSMNVKHRAFKYLYLIVNVRGYKEVVQFLPHKISDLEIVLKYLEQQNPGDTETWETRYGLLLWLSIIIMLPFNMSLLDSGAQAITVTDRLLSVTKLYLMGSDSCRNPAALLLARFVARGDIKTVHLKPTIDWLLEKITNVEPFKEWEKFGPLACLASMLKHGKREDLLQYSQHILASMLQPKANDDKYPLSSKYFIKIISRIGLVFLKPRIPSWRYDRGSRSLLSNLLNEKPPPKLAAAGDAYLEIEDDDESIPTEIESIIDELITGLKSSHSITRWSAAKGIGRLVSRLNRSNGDDVVSCVMDVIDFRNNEGAWSGACLAIAELAKWGLLLPTRLSDLVPLMTKALVYDVPRGYTSVGTFVRDAACYVCWAIARAYEPSVIEPYVLELAKTLVAVACFDREINCRRAAAAAFQEMVGRLGNIPHGIEVLTEADFYTVGIRSNCYLKISFNIGKFKEYTRALIDHLINCKVNSWDPTIRKLASKALFRLTSYDLEYAGSHCLQLLLRNVQTMDLHSRHGSILAIGEIIHALSLQHVSLDRRVLREIENLVYNLKESSMLVGASSKPANLACLSFIENCSMARLPFLGRPVIAQWQELIDNCLDHESAEIRDAARFALKQICEVYYSDESSDAVAEICKNIVEKYTIMVTSNKLNSRKGYSLALGCLPVSMLRGHLPEVIRALTECSHVTKQTILWAESRATALKALANICTNVRLSRTDLDISCYELVVGVINALLRSFYDYTVDERGDVGAWVREAAMLGLMDVLIMTVDEAYELVYEDIVARSFVQIAQQAVEKIDRTRGIAGKVFKGLLHKEGKQIPFIPGEDKVRAIFTKEVCETVNWICPQDTFPMFIQLLNIPVFTYSLTLGLVASAGGITESLAKCANMTLYQHLRSQPREVKVHLCDMILMIFSNHQREDRVTLPLLTFLSRALESGCLEEILLDRTSMFATKLLNYAKVEVAKSTNTKKLTISVNYFCQLVQVGGEVARRSLMQLTILLCHRFLWLRRLTASKFFEVLMVYGENSGVSSSRVEQAQTILTDTRWDSTDKAMVKQKRNEICTLLGLPKPIVVVHPLTNEEMI